MKHALSEQVKLCPTIHASLEQFEPGDLPFRLTAGLEPGLEHDAMMAVGPVPVQCKS